MKKEMTIAEVRELYKSDKVFATGGGFIFNDHGKYRSGLTFVLGSEFELSASGSVVEPTAYVEDKGITDNFNLDLDGSASLMFGDFWRSQKGAPCFRPKDPREAQHLLICVSWGGCFNKHRGYRGDAVKECGALYFRVASSNGGGAGYDYWVLPVGYVRDYDSDKLFRIDHKAASEQRKRHSERQTAERAEADKLLREKLAREAESKANKEKFLPRLLEIEAEFAKLREEYHNAGKIEIREDCFILNHYTRLYSEENMAEAEERLVHAREWVAEQKAKALAKQQAYVEFAPKFLALADRAAEAGLIVNAESEEEAIISDGRPATVPGWRYAVSNPDYHAFGYSAEGLEAAEAIIREAEEKVAEKRRAEAKAQAETDAKAAGLPSDVRIWHRSGKTNAGAGWVIDELGMDRERDEVDASMLSTSKQRGGYEGYHVWRQILPGELVIQWSKAFTAAEHVFEIIHRPATLTEAQLERVAEIQASIEYDWEGCVGLVSKEPSPSIGEGWLAELI